MHGGLSPSIQSLDQVENCLKFSFIVSRPLSDFCHLQFPFSVLQVIDSWVGSPVTRHFGVDYEFGVH